MSYMMMNFRKIGNATAHSACQAIAYLKEFFDTRTSGSYNNGLLYLPTPQKHRSHCRRTL
jgi:hypothetical protein